MPLSYDMPLGNWLNSSAFPRCDTQLRTQYQTDMPLGNLLNSSASTKCHVSVVLRPPPDSDRPWTRTPFQCNKDYTTSHKLKITDKLIGNVVRIPASLYTNKQGTAAVSHDILCNSKNESNKFFFGKPRSSQQSDRTILAGSHRVVPSRGNSTKRSKTSMRPGTQSPGGIGVDIKHNSYQRYLLKKKGIHTKF